MNKPLHERIPTIYAVDGEKLCRYIAEKVTREHKHVSVSEHEVYDFIHFHKFGYDDNPSMDDLLFELIIEEEDYCNSEPHDRIGIVLKAIADEFGGHFNINFLSICAYI